MQIPESCRETLKQRQLNLHNFSWHKTKTKLAIFFSLLQLDDAAIQVYKDGDFGTYLDLESSLAEQSEDIEGLNTK